MANQKFYVLRSDGRYLDYLSFDGTRAGFGDDLDRVCLYTAEERDQFKKEYPYIKGRWVLRQSEVKRMRAAEIVLPIQNGKNGNG